MMRAFALPALLVYVVFFPVLMPFRLVWGWLRVREELRGLVWSRENLQKAVHEVTLIIWPPATAFAVWALYEASAWGPAGIGGEVRGAVLGWIGAGLVVLAVLGARYGEVVDGGLAQVVPEHLLRYLLGYAAVFSLFVLVALMMVLLPLALVLSI